MALGMIMLSTIASASFIPSNALFYFDLYNLTQDDLKTKYNLSTSTALLDPVDKVMKMDYKNICKYDNEPTLPNCMSSDGGASIINSDLEGKQIKQTGAGSRLQVYPPLSVNVTYTAWVSNSLGSSWSHALMNPDSSASVVTQGGVTETVTNDLAYHNGISWVTTNIRGASSTDYVFFKLVGSTATQYIYNFSNIFNASRTTYVRNDGVRISTEGSAETRLDVPRFYNGTPDSNSSANMTEFIRQSFATAQSSYDVSVYSNTSEANLDLQYAVSCNNGSNYAYGSETNFGNNLTTITCPSSQSSNELILRVYYVNSNSNISAVIVTAGGSTDLQNPQLNISKNKTNIEQGDVINISSELSDDVGLSFCTIINNQSGFNQFYNFSLSGTLDKCSQNISISLGNGGVINFTALVNDTSNKKNQTSIISTIDDIIAPKIHNFTLQRQPIMNKTQTNIFTVFCEDTETFLDLLNVTLTYNLTTTNYTRFLKFQQQEGYGISGQSGSTINLNTKTYIWNYSFFSSDETAKEGNYNITHVGCNDKANNYAKNDSANALVGYDFLMDTLPVINSKTPADGGTITTTTINMSLVITEDNPSFMLLYHNINGTMKLNQTKTYIGDGLTENQFDNVIVVDGQSYNWSVSLNTSFGNWVNSSNFTFTVDLPDGGGGTTGGGGGSAPEKIVEVIREVPVERCGNLVCEGCENSIDPLCEEEGPLSCPVDCKFFSIDDAFCTPIFNCGNWKKSWFINTMIIFIMVGMIYMQYKRKGPKRL